MDTKLKLIHIVEQYPLGIHLRALSRALKTGLPNVKRYVTILEKEDVITKHRDANTLKIMLKEGHRTIAYLKYIHTIKFLSLPQKIQLAINDMMDLLEDKPLITLIFGSYARGDFTENSDIDVLMVFQRLEHIRQIENVSKRISMRTNTELSPVYLDYPDFEKNFLDRNHAFSKELHKEVIVLTGTEYFYPLLWRSR